MQRRNVQAVDLHKRDVRVEDLTLFTCISVH